MNNLEYPQYTKPDEAYGLKVPEVLLNWNHKKIQEWRDEHMWNLSSK
jgi:tRNA (guanine37-N1)-methyltransferase